MTKTYLVSYDLGSPESSLDYQKVINYLKSFGLWAKPLKSQFFVASSKTAEQIRDELMRITDSNDKILVIDVSNDYWAAYNVSKEVTDWMNANM